MGTLPLLGTLGALLIAAEGNVAAGDRFEFTQVEMAVPIRIVLYAADRQQAEAAAQAAFVRIRQLNDIMSDYDEASELRRLCQTAGGGHDVPVSPELWQVLQHAQTLSARSGGAFDVTVGPLVRLWRRARRQKELPSDQRLSDARPLVGYRLVRLDPRHRAVELLKPGVRLDLGGIAKGYAADEALGVLAKRGIRSALIDAGGDIVLGDAPPGRPGWRIGVARLEADGPPSHVLVLSRAAVATSGDRWQYVEIGGKRYSHIVDPHTGLGLTDHSSVTVVAADGITADGLASAVSVLGPKEGLKLIEDTPGAEALIVRVPEKKMEKYESAGWRGLGANAD